MRVSVKDGESAVLGRGCSNQRIGQRHAVVAVAAPGELPEGTHRRIGDHQVVAQDAQRVELKLQLEILRARAS